MIRRWPAGDHIFDREIRPRRDLPRMGTFGAIVYVYRGMLESPVQTNMKDQSKGYMYHPVDTQEEAEEWLAYYKSKTVTDSFEPRPLYEDAFFVPRGPT